MDFPSLRSSFPSNPFRQHLEADFNRSINSTRGRCRTWGPFEGHAHTHTVIFLHEEGSTADQFASELFESETSKHRDKLGTLRTIFPSFRWIFPMAPKTKHFDQEISQWFNMRSTKEPNLEPKEQVEGLRESMDRMLRLIQVEEKVISTERIFLGGIGQGFAVMYPTFFLDGRQFAGLIGLSSWAPLEALKLMKWKFDEIQKITTQYERCTPAFLSHSRVDQVVPVEEGRKLRDGLVAESNVVVRWQEYHGGGHWVQSPEGVDDIVDFLAEALPDNERPDYSSS